MTTPADTTTAPTFRELAEALRDAASRVDNHSIDEGLVTPASKTDEWRELARRALEPDPAERGSAPPAPPARPPLRERRPIPHDRLVKLASDGEGLSRATTYASSEVSEMAAELLRLRGSRADRESSPDDDDGGYELTPPARLLGADDDLQAAALSFAEADGAGRGGEASALTELRGAAVAYGDAWQSCMDAGQVSPDLAPIYEDDLDKVAEKLKLALSEMAAAAKFVNDGASVFASDAVVKASKNVDHALSILLGEDQ